MSFLIVDDNAVMRRTIRRIVSDLTNRIIECGDGDQALSIYTENQPEWVSMDIEMPGKDGLKATREICSVFPNARIVIVTNYSDTAMRQAAQTAGAIGFVAKENLLDLCRIIQSQSR